MVDKEFWAGALKNAESERAALLAERELIEQEREALQTRAKEIDAQLVQLDQTITSVTPLAHDGIDPDLAAFMHEMFTNLALDETSLANSCREILQAATGTWMTPVGIKNALIKAGYDEGKHSNLGASVHSVLKRLEQAGEVIRSTDSYQNAVYKWNTSAFRHSPLKNVGQRMTRRQQRVANEAERADRIKREVDKLNKKD
jgi:hypothetical protein